MEVRPVSHLALIGRRGGEVVIAARGVTMSEYWERFLGTVRVFVEVLGGKFFLSARDESPRAARRFRVLPMS